MPAQSLEFSSTENFTEVGTKRPLVPEAETSRRKLDCKVFSEISQSSYVLSTKSYLLCTCNFFNLRHMRKLLASATGAVATVFTCKAATYKIQNRKYEEGEYYFISFQETELIL